MPLPDADAARVLVDAIEHNRAGSRWSLYRFDGHSVLPESSHERDRVLVFFPMQLGSLRHFRLCDKNPNATFDIGLNLDVKGDSNVAVSLAKLFSKPFVENATGAGIQCWFSESEQARSDRYGVFHIDVGMRKTNAQRLISIWVHQFEKFADQSLRLRVFETAIGSLGLANAMQIVMDDASFRLEATAPWNLELSGADRERRNPTSFGIAPFPTFEDAWTRVERFLRSDIVKQINNVSIGFRFTPDSYETYFEEINTLANGWCVDLYGSYACGVDPYSAGVKAVSIGRFPLLTWMKEREGKGIFFQADLVSVNNGQILEIHSNCGDLQKLLKEAKAATGLTFKPLG